jgi:hypothetical protein
MTLISGWRTALFGLRNGYLNGRHSKHWDSGLSIDTLQRIFYSYLNSPPTVKIIKRDKVHLRMDATYFNRFCLLCYQDHEDGYTQLIRFSDGEHFEGIKEDLSNLIRLGVQIESITTDGHKCILKAIKKTLPEALSQRAWCTSKECVYCG